MIRDQFRALLISSLGGVLEFYDFFVYALLAGVLSHQFFPTHSATASLLYTFATYAVGYVARPVGGLLVGHFGDTHGRQKAFSSSVLMMALSTFCIALIPNFHQIGLAAPALLVALRFVQGFSVGGEIPGAITYVTESLPEHRGLACGMVFFCLTLGAVFASLMIASIKSFVGLVQFEQWAWRLLFLFGGVFGFISFYCRRYLSETSLFSAQRARATHWPVTTLMRRYPREMLYGVAISAVPAVVSTLGFLYVPAYLTRIVKQPIEHYMWINMALYIVCAIGNLLMGWLTDRVNKQTLLTCMCFMTMVVAYPLFYVLAYHQAWLAWVLSAAVVANVLGYGVVPVVLAELFPMPVRYSGIAFCYNFGQAFFAGLAPLFATLLIHVTGSVLAPALVLIVVGSVCLFCVMYQQFVTQSFTAAEV